jgi:hypothetical protein
MALIVGRGVDIDFDDANAWIFCVRGHPFGGDENFWMYVVRHGVSPSR